MSKHTTSELSPRDIACIEYGRKYRALEAYCGEWLMESIPLEMKEERAAKRRLINELRAARERIFRCCFECEHCEIEAGYCFKPGEEPCELTWQYDDACTCEHYEERREV